jgi:hypothetical protein
VPLYCVRKHKQAPAFFVTRLYDRSVDGTDGYTVGGNDYSLFESVRRKEYELEGLRSEHRKSSKEGQAPTDLQMILDYVDTEPDYTSSIRLQKALRRSSNDGVKTLSVGIGETRDSVSSQVNIIIKQLRTHKTTTIYKLRNYRH